MFALHNLYACVINWYGIHGNTLTWFRQIIVINKSGSFIIRIGVEKKFDFFY